jgi:sugar O-acyltransferase (sialic acid O-acetyltransferase NeuD family)
LKKVVIVGAGGLGKDVADYVEDISKVDSSTMLAGIIDDDETKLSSFRHRPYFTSTIDNYKAEIDHYFFVAVGNPKVKKELVSKLSKFSLPFCSLIHPRSYISKNSTIEEGSLVAPFAVVSAQATVGTHCVLNIFSSCCHDSSMGDYTVLSPYATLNGNVRTEEGCFLGTHATIAPTITLGAWSVVGASATVLHDVVQRQTVVGTPAKPK